MIVISGICKLSSGLHLKIVTVHAHNCGQPRKPICLTWIKMVTTENIVLCSWTCVNIMEIVQCFNFLLILSLNIIVRLDDVIVHETKSTFIHWPFWQVTAAITKHHTYRQILTFHTFSFIDPTIVSNLISECKISSSWKHPNSVCSHQKLVTIWLFSPLISSSIISPQRI